MGGFGKDTTYTVTKSETCGVSSETHYYFQGWEFNGTIYVNSEKLSTAIDKYIKDNKDKTEVTLTASWNTKQYDGAIGCTEPINNNFTDAYVMPIFTAIIIAILAYYIAAQKRKGKAKRKM